jgi:MraZ protein
MSSGRELILGEFPRTLDERYRVALPAELAGPLTAIEPVCILAKERPGCLSLWDAAGWKNRFDSGVELVKGKIKAGRLEGRLEEVQLLGRLLSTRHKTVELGDKSRLLIPEGFREFLGVEAGSEVLLVGAAVCVEIWQPRAWINHLETHMEEFPKLFGQLSS